MGINLMYKSFFSYDLESYICKTYITEIEKSFSLYGQISFSGKPRKYKPVSLQMLRQPSKKFWPKILTPYFFYSNLYLHFLRPCCENIFKIVCIVSEKIGK